VLNEIAKYEILSCNSNCLPLVFVLHVH